MTRYAVIVRDECSEAITTVEIEAERREDARVQALNKAFREMGWRKTSTGILDVEEVGGKRMKTIWKTTLDPEQLDGESSIYLDMPFPFEILTVQEQQNEITLWAIVDDGAVKARRRFYVYGTGQIIPDSTNRFNYVGTVQLFYHGNVVVHVFREELTS